MNRENGTVNQVVSLVEVSQSAGQDGPAWTLESDDLNVNLVVLRAGHSIAEHINSEVDVVVTAVEGEGHVTIDGETHRLVAGDLIVIGKGSARSITPHGAQFAYVTCHKRRTGLWPTTNE